MGSQFSSPGNLPNPGIGPRSPALQVGSLPAEPPRKLKETRVCSLSLLQRIFQTQESNQGLCPSLPLDWYHLRIWGCWCFSHLSWFQRVMDHCLVAKGLAKLNGAMSHALYSHPRQKGHSRDFWQNVIHWRREWQSSPVYLLWESQDLHKRTKRYVVVYVNIHYVYSVYINHYLSIYPSLPYSLVTISLFSRSVILLLFCN